MPDVQSQTTEAPADRSPAITDLVPKMDDKSMAGLVASLDKNIHEKADADKKLMGEFNVQSAKDKAIRDEAFRAEGVAAAEVPKPWNADQEHKKYETNPIEGFGSAGGLFAMVASAFTKAPMQSAIEGMAGAITSIQNGNEKAYERAFDAFKTNVKLAEQRFKTQHELYQDALSLGTADAAASAAKFHNAAVRFGDQQMLALADAGHPKEIYELIEARAKSMEQAVKAADAIDLHAAQDAAIEAVKRNFQPSGDPVQDKINLAGAIQIIRDGGKGYGSTEQTGVGRILLESMAQNKNAMETADRFAEYKRNLTAKAPNWEAFYQQRDLEEAQSGQKLSPERETLLMQMYGLTNAPKGSAAGSQSSQARKTRAIEEIQAKHAVEGKPISMAEAEREFNNTVQVVSAHDKFTSDIQYDKVERMKDSIGKVEDLLIKHKFIAGIGGTLTRPIEAVANILGSNETDRKQFEREVLEIKEWGQAALMDRSGRPLSSEAAEAGKIFAGLKPGDTTANTLRAYMELRPVLAKLQEQIKARGQGKGPVSGGGASSPPAQEGDKKPLWQSAPVAQ